MSNNSIFDKMLILIEATLANLLPRSVVYMCLVRICREVGDSEHAMTASNLLSRYTVLCRGGSLGER